MASILSDLRRMIDQEKVEWLIGDEESEGSFEEEQRIIYALRRATPIQLEPEVVEEARLWCRDRADSCGLRIGPLDPKKETTFFDEIRVPFNYAFFEWKEGAVHEGETGRSVIPCGVLVASLTEEDRDALYFLLVARSPKVRWPLPIGDMIILRRAQTLTSWRVSRYSNDQVIDITESEDPGDASHATAMVAVTGIAWYAIWVLGGENVVLAQDPSPLKKRKKKKREATWRGVRWHHIRVLSKGTRRKTGLIVDPQRTPVEPMVSHHMCRGHWKTYTEEKPLLGRAVGRFWWKPHLRGSTEVGIVGHDYELLKEK